MKESKSHKDLHTGILDMNGVPILKGSTIKVHDKGWSREEKIGKVTWKQGSYVCKGTSCEYNIYAWRKKIEVLDSKYPSKFNDDECEELCEQMERNNMDFHIQTPSEHRAIFRKAFKLGYWSRVELEYSNEHK